MKYLVLLLPCLGLAVALSAAERLAITATHDLAVVIGFNKNPADKNQDPQIAVTSDGAQGSLVQWVAQKTNGELGTAVIGSAEAFQGFAEDARNQLVIAQATPGKALVYFAGAGWSKAGEFTTVEAWSDYVAACAQRARSPLTITLAVQP